MRALRFAVATLSLVGVACTSPSSSPDQATGHDRAALLGGKASADAATVLVLIQLEKNPTEETSFECTGVVVSPHVVLTAAHCVSPEAVKDGQSFFIFKGGDANDEKQLAVRKNFGYAKEVRYHEKFDLAAGEKDGGDGYDIGAIVLLDPVGIEPARLPKAPLSDSDVGRALRIAGYGMHTPGDLDSQGRREEGEVTLGGLEARQLWFIPPSTRGPAFCGGDSGGPSFLTVGEREVVVGIHSWGEHHQSCTGKMIDTRVDAHLEGFVLPIVREADPGFLESQIDPENVAVAEPAADAGGPPALAAAAPAPPAQSGGCAVSRDLSGDAALSRWIALAGLVVASALARRRSLSRRSM